MTKQELIKKLRELPDFEVVIPDQESNDVYYDIELNVEIDFLSGQDVIVLRIAD